MASQYQGLFQQFGLPAESEQDYITRKKIGAYQQSMANNPFASRSAAGAIGAGIAAAFARRGAQLTDQEAQQFKASADARNNFEAAASAGQYADMGAQEKANAFQGILARAAYDNGMAEVGASIGADLGAKLQKKKRGDMEMARLNQQLVAGGQAIAAGDVAAKYQETGLQQQQASRALQNQQVRNNLQQDHGLTNVFRHDNPNEPIMVALQPDGSAQYADEVLAPGTFSPTDLRAKGGGVGRVPMGGTEAKEHRKKISTMTEKWVVKNQQLQVLGRASRLLHDVGGARSILGTSGGVKRTAAKWMNEIRDMTSTLKPAMYENKGAGPFSKDFLFDTNKPIETAIKVKKADRATRNYLDALAQRMEIPGGLRSEFDALVIMSGYTQARTNEDGGGAKISDQDVRLATASNGDSVADPAVLRRVYLNSLGQDKAKANMTRALESGLGQTAITGDAWALFDNETNAAESFLTEQWNEDGSWAVQNIQGQGDTVGNTVFPQMDQPAGEQRSLQQEAKSATIAPSVVENINAEAEAFEALHDEFGGDEYRFD